MKILLAEDDATSRQILKAQLLKLGNAVEGREDGEKAWEAFQADKPDVVITDWLMPKVDGLELCRRIRSAPVPGYTYVMVLTAQDRNIGYLDGMDAGADDFITKPCDISELTVRLRAAERILALQTHVSRLEGLLPICPKCKRIYNGTDKWEAVEGFFMKRSDAHFSHGICPECYESQMKPQLEMMRKRRK